MLRKIGTIALLAPLSLLCLFSLFSVWERNGWAGVKPSTFSVPLKSGFDTSRYWVEFDPQPEPPGRELFLDISVPTAPVFKVNSSSGGEYRLEFAIQDSPQRISGFKFQPALDGFKVSASSLMDPVLFTASFSFAEKGLFLALGSDVKFDPQPEPPGYPGVVVSFSLERGSLLRSIQGDNEVEMTLRISDPDENPVPLARWFVPFVRGDSNADGATDISDGIAILGYLFLGEKKVPCEQAGDVNDDGSLDISDSIYVLSFLFLGGKPIEPPVGACGLDPTRHSMPCSSFPGCQ